MQEKLYFREELLIPLHNQIQVKNLDKGPLYLEYQRLNDLGDRIEAKGNIDNEIQSLLEMIGEKQTEILNQISIN